MIFERARARVEGLALPRDTHTTYDLRADESGVSLDGKLRLPIHEIANVAIVLEDRYVVRVRRRGGGGFECWFTDQDEVEQFVEALGRPSANVILENELEPNLFRAGFDDRPAWQLLLVGLVQLVVLLVRGLVFARAAMRSEEGAKRALLAGTDGVTVDGVFEPGFIPYAQLASVTTQENALVLEKRNGRKASFPFRHPSRLAETAARIEAGIRKATPHTDSETAAKLREAGGVIALRNLGFEKDGAYRETRIPRERLWDVLEDPNAAHDVRARAAIALSRDLPAEEKQRIRIAADATVSPLVRVAVDQLEDSDDLVAERLDARLRKA